MDNEILRDEFEQWVMTKIIISKSTLVGLRTDGGYRNTTLSGRDYNLMWESWVASRENLDIDKLKKERNEAIGHLISVFDQYAGLDHLFMSAGENACEFLEGLGYGVDTGRVFALSEKILELNNGE